MGQRFYIDENDLNGQLDRLDRNLMEMLEFAYLHEDMVNTIEQLMSEWGVENLSGYQQLRDEYDALSEEDKEYYDEFEDFLFEAGRWWIGEFDNLEDVNEKKNFIERYRLTIVCGLHSDTYDVDKIREEIEGAWEHIMV